MKPGDLLRAKSVNPMRTVRVYTDDQCESWDRYADHEELFLFLSEHQNRWKQDVITVLSAEEIAWVYSMDIELINVTSPRNDRMNHDKND